MNFDVKDLGGKLTPDRTPKNLLKSQLVMLMVMI